MGEIRITRVDFGKPGQKPRIVTGDQQVEKERAKLYVGLENSLNSIATEYTDLMRLWQNMMDMNKQDYMLKSYPLETRLAALVETIKRAEELGGALGRQDLLKALRGKKQWVNKVLADLVQERTERWKQR